MGILPFLLIPMESNWTVHVFSRTLCHMLLWTAVLNLAAGTHDWLLLQTPQLVFLEGETITLRCHSWRNKLLNRISFFHNEKSVRYHHYSSNFSIPKANHSHSGDYYCKGSLGRTLHQSKPVTITVQGPKSSRSLPVLTIVAAVTGIAVAAIVIILVSLVYLKKKQVPDNPPDLEEAAKTEAENTITYSLLKHPEALDEETEHDYQNHI
ncbi:low affinity immunoglobulin gamma Fc region receptor II-b isoform 8 [Mus musculus]|uniref:low affinity immunoglobulin gamma Fc region receptor II-b isoform 8 n=1 Tax=Mus musculus TaxID=10090 RepID=UPI0023EF54DD|nr:low affinity immunoglobulin gamma Fc region receptor II-b isoform 8 [Mus musculus]